MLSIPFWVAVGIVFLGMKWLAENGLAALELKRRPLAAPSDSVAAGDVSTPMEVVDRLREAA